ncbi:MAG: type III secretion system chaperone [Pseudomonadota bacterium]
MTMTRARALLEETGFVRLGQDFDTTTPQALWLEGELILGFYDEARDRLILRGVVGEVIEPAWLDAYRVALQYNSHAGETMTRLAHAEDGNLVQITELLVETLDVETLVTCLTNFLERLVQWRDTLVEWDFGADDVDDESENKRSAFDEASNKHFLLQV